MPRFAFRSNRGSRRRRGRHALAATWGIVLGAWIGAASCTGREQLPPAPPPKIDGGDPDAFDFDTGGGPPPADADAGGVCGNQVHALAFDAPNLYFVLDASGSMSVPDGSKTRYEKVQDAAVKLVRNLGPLINVGAATFPSDVTPSSNCNAGQEVMPVLPGDPYDGDMDDGPTTVEFKQKTSVAPNGGTPTSSTLDDLFPGIVALPGKTIVVLATDGGPNCNPQATCGPEGCQWNIEGRCNTVPNCCDASDPMAPGGPLDCVDEAATVGIIGGYASSGVKVYVVGIPGSEAYGDVLDQMALAGGAPQLVSPHYYKVDDTDGLLSVFGSIAALEVSCIFQVEDPPTEAGMTNVYVNGVVLPFDAMNGWAWQDAQTFGAIVFKGQACTDLLSGKFKQVQIVSGCPTEIPN